MYGLAIDDKVRTHLVWACGARFFNAHAAGPNKMLTDLSAHAEAITGLDILWEKRKLARMGNK